jgi:hypothetical protein
VVSLDSVYKRATKDVDRSLIELGVKGAWHAIAQQGFHGLRLVRHTCRHRWAIQPRTGMRLRESHYLRPGRPSREAISALRHTERRPPSPDDWGRWRTPEVDRVPCLGRVQQACARCTYFIHAIEGHHRIIDGSLLYVREAFLPNASKYSYHWQTHTGELLLRWDNAPHHPESSTHPHHKHVGGQIGPSARVSIEDVLAELAATLKSKGQVEQARGSGYENAYRRWLGGRF